MERWKRLVERKWACRHAVADCVEVLSAQSASVSRGSSISASSASHAQLATALTAILFVTSCAARLDATKYSRSSTTYVGIVTIDIRRSAADAPVLALGATTVGLRIRDGISAGFLRDHALYIPVDCRVVFLVRTNEQLNTALVRLKELQEKDVCVSKDQLLR